MIGYLNEEEKKRSEILWKQAFPEDSESFDRYYFSEKMRENRVLAKTEGTELVSMAHLNPYLVQAGVCVWRSDYIVGVATHRDKRHRGYMREVLTRMMQDMYEEKMPFCFLMPADERIYLPFDFTYIFDQPHWKLKEGTPLERVSLEECGKTPAELATFMGNWLSDRYEVYCKRDEAYVNMLLKELDSENGETNLLYHGTRLVGMESQWGIDKKEQRLLYCEPEYVEEEKEASPAIMARIICMERFVEAVRLKESCPEEEITVRLAVEDKFLPQNHGSYLWHLNHKGSCLEKVSGEVLQQDGAEDCPVIPVSRLTAWLFGYSRACGAEWMNKVKTLEGVFLDEVV